MADTKVFVEMSRAAYGAGAHGRSFDELRACAERGESGLKLVELPANAIVRRDMFNDVCMADWMDDKRDPHRVMLDKNVAWFRRGDKGQAWLLAQNW